MPSIHGGTSPRPERRRRPRPSEQTFLDHLETLNNNKQYTDLFEQWDLEGIIEALHKEKVLELRSVVDELALDWLQRHQSIANPNWEPRSRAAPRMPRPRTQDIVDHIIGEFTNPRRRMSDGRRLEEWTVGELRREFRGMEALLGRFEHYKDSDVIGDIWED